MPADELPDAAAMTLDELNAEIAGTDAIILPKSAAAYLKEERDGTCQG